MSQSKPPKKPSLFSMARQVRIQLATWNKNKQYPGVELKRKISWTPRQRQKRRDEITAIQQQIETIVQMARQRRYYEERIAALENRPYSQSVQDRILKLQLEMQEKKITDPEYFQELQKLQGFLKAANMPSGMRNWLTRTFFRSNSARHDHKKK